MPNDDLNDSLDDLLGGPIVGPAKRMPQADTVKATADYSEPCPKCRGRGRFISYAGRDIGPCFACEGKGRKTFKTPAADRAEARQKAALRKMKKLTEQIAEFRATESAVSAWIDSELAKPRPFAFAVSMAEALNTYGSLTDGQLP